MRRKQSYLVNPRSNPWIKFKTPARHNLAFIDKKGKLKSVMDLNKSINKKKKHKARKISNTEAMRLKHAWLLTNKPKKKAVKKKVVKKIRLSKTALAHKTALDVKRAQKFKGITKKKSKKSKATSKNRNPLMLINVPSIRRKSVMKKSKKRRRKSVKKYRRNPMVKMITKREGKQMVGLLMDGAVLLGGVTLATMSINKLTEQFPMLAKPSVRMGTLLALSTTAYIVGTRTKKLPAHYVNLIALGLLMPLVTDALGMIRSGISFPALANDKDYIPQGASAWVPERNMTAWVPNADGLGSYGENHDQASQY